MAPKTYWLLIEPMVVGCMDEVESPPYFTISSGVHPVLISRPLGMQTITLKSKKFVTHVTVFLGNETPLHFFCLNDGSYHK